MVKLHQFSCLILLHVFNIGIQAQTIKFEKIQCQEKWGVINQNQTIVIPCTYQDIRIENANLIICSKKDSVNFYNNKFEKIASIIGNTFLGCAGALDIKQKIPFLFIHSFNTQLVRIHSWNNGRGLDTLFILNGELKDFEYSFESARKNILIKNKYLKVIKKKKYGIADHLGNIIIKPQYENIFFLNDRYLIVKRRGKFGIIDMNNKTIVPIQYTDIIYDYSNNITAEKHLKVTLGIRIVEISYYSNFDNWKVGDLGKQIDKKKYIDILGKRIKYENLNPVTNKG